MRALALDLGADVRQKNSPALAGRLAALSGAAYGLAARYLAGREGAEDVVQQAYLDALEFLRANPPPGNERAWFLKVAANAAKMHLRSEAARQRREAAVQPRDPPDAAVDAELVARLRAAVNALDEKFRIPVTLCCEQGLSQREAAEVLELPESTVSKYVNVGLSRLRESLKKAGYVAAPAAMMGALAHTAPPVPATLTAAITKLVADGAGVVGAQHAVPLLVKGGLLMKIGLGVVAAGLAAGATFWAVGGKAEDKPAAPPERAQSAPATGEKSKFDIPVWHPDARWKKDPRPATGMLVPASGELMGPGREVMERHFTESEPAFFKGLTTGGRGVCTMYDPRADRFAVTAGSGRGYLDGPFSRARFGGATYSSRHKAVLSPDRRYGFIAQDGKLRCLDFQEQVVTTLLPKEKFDGSIAVDGKGTLWSIGGDKQLRFITPKGEMQKGPTLEIAGKGGSVGGEGYSLAIDEVHNRLYAADMGTPGWYIWYWDAKDGSFHGVLPRPEKGAKTRAADEPGPFGGTKLYDEGRIAFGPDDPGKRFLYTGRVDTYVFFRLDLEKQEIWAFSADEGCFIGSGRAKGGAQYGQPPVWGEDGSFYGSEKRGWNLFRRTR